MKEKVSTMIRLPQDVARAVIFHPGFADLRCAAQLAGHWVERNGSRWYEVYNPPADLMAELVAFAYQVAGDMIESYPRQ